MMSSREQGFSAVELLITLFIGVVFLLGGYQVWAYTQRSGVESDQQARASNLAYLYLRKYSTSSGACSPSTPTILPQPTADGLTNVNVSVTISCPYSSASSVSKVTSTVSYSANPTKSVTHAVFTN